MTKDNLNKLVLTIITATIFGGWNWIRDIETRIAIIEDDLDETVTVIGVLHPPSPIRPATFFADAIASDKCGPRCQARRKNLRDLKPDAPTPDAGDDNEGQEAPDEGRDPGVDVPGC